MFFRHSLFVLLGMYAFLAIPITTTAEPRLFSEISLDMQDSWEGEERTAFITGNRDEYMLTLAKKNSEGDSYVAQISIYILPNKSALTAKESAAELAKKQDDVSNLEQDGPFWKFTGYPKSNIVKGMAITRVAATSEWWCFIIAQDTQTDEAEKMIASLRGLTERTKALLGK